MSVSNAPLISILNLLIILVFVLKVTFKQPHHAYYAPTSVLDVSIAPTVQI